MDRREGVPVEEAPEAARLEEGRLDQARAAPVGPGVDLVLEPGAPGELHLGAEPEERGGADLLDAPEVDGVADADVLRVTAAAPHPDAAHAFIDFILTPAVQAQETGYTYYATGVDSAIPCMDPVVGGDKSIFPAADVTAKLEVHKDLGDAIKLRDELWTKFKSA